MESHSDLCLSPIRGKAEKINQTKSFDFKYCASPTIHDYLSQTMCKFILFLFNSVYFNFFFVFVVVVIVFCLLGPHTAYRDSQAGVKSELQQPAYTTATATLDPSHVCDLHHNSRQHQILNPLGEAKDQTCVLTDASHIRFQ